MKLTKQALNQNLDGSALRVEGKTGAYEIHNVHAEPSKSLCSTHKTLGEVNDRIVTVLGVEYGK